jgi:hypothetical protein
MKKIISTKTVQGADGDAKGINGKLSKNILINLSHKCRFFCTNFFFDNIKYAEFSQSENFFSHKWGDSALAL